MKTLLIKRRLQKRPDRYTYDILHTYVYLKIDKSEYLLRQFDYFVSRDPTKGDRAAMNNQRIEVDAYINVTYAALCKLSPDLLLSYEE